MSNMGKLGKDMTAAEKRNANSPGTYRIVPINSKSSSGQTYGKGEKIPSRSNRASSLSASKIAKVESDREEMNKLMGFGNSTPVQSKRSFAVGQDTISGQRAALEEAHAAIKSGDKERMKAAATRLHGSTSKLAKEIKPQVSKGRRDFKVKNAVPVGTEGGRWVTINGSPVYVKG